MLRRSVVHVSVLGRSVLFCLLRGSMAKISGMRADYRSKSEIFDLGDLMAKEPIGQFQAWLEEACQVPSILEANAMALATASRTGLPSVRMVLLKGCDKDGFKFYTNFESRKAQDLEENPRCSLMFYWEPLRRSVRIEGTVEKLSQEEAEEYFHSRPRSSQLGALVSRQSSIVPSRQFLDEKNAELEKEYADLNKTVPKPSYWGGYVVRHEEVEFWQGQTNRLHDRILFRREKSVTDKKEMYQAGSDGWMLCRLSP